MYMLSTRDPLWMARHTHTEIKGMEKEVSCKWKWEKAGIAILISDKIDFEVKAIKRQKMTLHNDKGMNPTRGYNPSKHLHTQHRSP